MNPNSHTVAPASGRSLKAEIATALGLAGLIVVSRWTIDLPNFQPVMAIAMLAGFLFQRQWLGWASLLAGMLFADSLLGFYDIRLSSIVYLALMLPLLGGLLLRRWQDRPWRFMAGMFGVTSLAAASFYAMTNVAVWWFADWYPPTRAGLGMAMLMGLPFLKWTLLANLTFTPLLFAAASLGTRWQQSPVGRRVAVVLPRD